MAELKVTIQKITDIKEYPGNPRRNEKAVKATMNSIRRFGFRNPVILNRDKVILAGHTRIKAAKEAGREEIPCIIVDTLSEEQEKAFRLADNRVSEFSEWDKEILAQEMKRLKVDWNQFGFSEDLQVEEPGVCTCPKCGKDFML